MLQKPVYFTLSGIEAEMYFYHEEHLLEVRLSDVEEGDLEEEDFIYLLLTLKEVGAFKNEKEWGKKEIEYFEKDDDVFARVIFKRVKKIM